MSGPLHPKSLVLQAAEHIREGCQSGRWHGQLPGVLSLADELMVSKDTVREAMKVLEAQGWIEYGGAGRRRKIVGRPGDKPSRRNLRIGVMLYVPLVDDDVLTATILLRVRHDIESAGHVCVFGERCLKQMKDNLAKISRCVTTADADAWIVITASRAVLEWFSAQPFPVFAYGGRFQNLPVACSSTRMAPAIESAVNTLVEHGHRRIVLLIETFLRKPVLIPSLMNYMSFLEAHGIAATDYNLPHFEETVDSMEGCLEGLFRLTPPTALIVHHSHHCAALLFFLGRRGLRVPDDVSVVSMSSDPTFTLCQPVLDHFRVPRERHVTRIARWVEGVAKGRPDKRQVMFDAEYVPGGTVGPAKN